MTYALRDNELDLIQAAIRFANSRPRDAQKTVSAFLNLCDFEANLEDLLLPEAESECLEYQDRLRGWFERIVESNSQRSEVAQEVSLILWEAVKVNLRVVEKRNFRYIETRFGFISVPGILAMAAALILDESYGLTNRLKKCGNPKCGKFNLDLKPHGRPRTHCNAACKKAADVTTGAKRRKKCRDEKRQKQNRR